MEWLSPFPQQVNTENIWIPFICYPINWKYSLYVQCLSHRKTGSRNDRRGGRKGRETGGALSESYCWSALRFKLMLGLIFCHLQPLYKIPHKYMCVPQGALFHKLGKWNLYRGNVIWNVKPISSLSTQALSLVGLTMLLSSGTPEQAKHPVVARSRC